MSFPCPFIPCFFRTLVQEYLDEQQTVDMETFTGRVWDNIHQIYSSSAQGGAEETASPQEGDGVEQDGQGAEEARGEELSPEDEDEERHRDEEEDEDDEEGEGREDDHKVRQF